MDSELEKLLGNLSLDDLDNVVNRMERVKLTNNKDDDVMGLLGAMSSLSMVTNKQKLNKAIEGVKKFRKKVFAKKYKSLKGKKAKAVSSAQMDDLFATMDALKQEEVDNDESIDLDDMFAELDDDDDESMGGGGKKKKRSKKQKGGFSQRGPYEVHSRWPRFKIDQNMAMRDLKSVNQRGLRALKKLKGGAVEQRGPYQKHSTYPRYKINQKNAMRDLKSVNKRSLLRGGAKKKKIVKKSKKSLKKKPANKRKSKK